MEEASELDAFLETWRNEFDKTGSEADLWNHSATKELFEAASKLQQYYKDLESAMEQEINDLVSQP